MALPAEVPDRTHERAAAMAARRQESRMTRSVLRYEVPVDDEWHEFLLPAGEILHVGAKDHHTVSFWMVSTDDHAGWRRRSFRVFGTGQPLPLEAGRYIGTAVILPLVWHLFSREA
jgi:hypothetical protein